MNKVMVKICGVTNAEDALAAAGLGADFVGFNFYRESPRFISPAQAGEISSKLPEKVKKVGVFVNSDEGFINSAIKTAKLDFVQLHGDESPEFCGKIPVPVIKAFRIGSRNDLQKINEYDVDYILLDAFSAGKFGGTGKEINLSILKGFNFNGRKLFLGGGLNAGNVYAAIKAVRPFAVDVASGVEISPGKKDFGKMKKFIESVKKCQQ